MLRKTKAKVEVSASTNDGRAETWNTVASCSDLPSLIQVPSLADTETASTLLARMTVSWIEAEGPTDMIPTSAPNRSDDSLDEASGPWVASSSSSSSTSTWPR